MYKTRDVEIQLPVHPGACYVYDSKSHGQMCEIFTPTEDISLFNTFNQWGSIMVKLEQVRTANPALNIVYVNDGAEIISSVKDQNRTVLSQETLLPNQIIGRWLKWHRWYRFQNLLSQEELNIPSERLYADFAWSRLTVTEYVNRLPLHV